MKVEAPKKVNRESSKWEEHIQKKAKAPSKGSEAEIIPAKKKRSVAPVKVSAAPGQHKGRAEVKENIKAEKAKPEKGKETRAEAGKETREVGQKKTPVQGHAKSGVAEQGLPKAASHLPTGMSDTKREASTTEGVRPLPTGMSDIEEKLDDLNILKHPLVTEKAVNMIEAENKLTFVVDRNATKPGVRNAVESLYKVRVKKVSMLRDMKARKRAIVTLHKEFKAGEIATKLGVI